MRWLRRIHLYSGLALLPWVLIYAISAFLFNHGGTAVEPRVLPVPATALVDLAPDPDRLASTLLAALDAPNEDADGTLDGAWTFEYRVDDQSHRLTLPIDGSSATSMQRRMRRVDAHQIPADTFADEARQAERAAGKTLATAGIRFDRLRTLGGPSLRVTAAERTWSVDLGRQQVIERTGSAIDFASLMRRLHVTHGYRSSHWARLVWAVIVDVMALSMLLWAVSGIAMWWQKRSLRGSGSIAIAVATLLVVVLGTSLYALFSA